MSFPSLSFCFLSQRLVFIAGAIYRLLNVTVAALCVRCGAVTERRETVWVAEKHVCVCLCVQ